MKEGWEYKKLGEVCEVKGGKRIPKGMGFSDTKTSHPYLRVVDMKNGTIINNDIHYINDEVYERIKRYIITADDVYLTIAGTIGLAGTIPVELNNANLTENAAKIVFDKSVINNIYLSYYLNSCYMQGEIAKRTMAVGVPKLAIFRIEELPLAIPPLSEQQSIVAELDKINEVIDLKKAQLKDLDLLAQSIFYNMFGDPIENPKGWEVKKLGDVCKTTSGGTPSKTHQEYYENGTIPWLRSGEVSQGFIYNTELFISEEGLKNSSAKMIPVDSVAIAMYGATVGQVGIIKSEMCTNQAICSILPNNVFLPIYLYHFLMSKKNDYLSLASGGAQPNISQGIIKDTKIGIPPLPLQQEFAKKIEAIEVQKTAIKQSLSEAETLLASRMDYWFN